MAMPISIAQLQLSITYPCVSIYQISNLIFQLLCKVKVGVLHPVQLQQSN